ncbi:DUF3500 domain-containing protein [Verrucomicrobiales bacterium]|nr:DUF3500 domain-containing protein [Verrucomicrobiales bacterium]MDB4657458.1 DUF3500 domain-containing protein [Verrucomicrobiales bacterium]
MTLKPSISLTTIAILGASMLCSVAHAQQPQGKGKGGKGKGGSSRFAEREKAALAEPFVGVTADGKVGKELFEIKSTGVSTKELVDAANKFLAALTDEQRKKSTFPVDDDEWRRWANQHSLPRQGVTFEELDEKQRKLAFEMIGAGLSARGLKTTQDIMKLNHTIAELSGRHGEYGYGRWSYHLTFMGEPSETKPWGWQFDGHHCIINYFLLADQVVVTPMFLGSEPVWADEGDYAGTIVLQEEQDAGFALAKSLTDAQKKKAVMKSVKDGTNSKTEAFSDNVVIPYEGISVSELDDQQQEKFLHLCEQWIGNIREGHAKVKMAEIKAHLDKTYFAWVGEMKEDSVFFYRIHSPVVLIEFDHQRPIALGRSGEATRNHIHATIRTPNGNDYGKDLLRQHLLKHPH